MSHNALFPTGIAPSEKKKWQESVPRRLPMSWTAPQLFKHIRCQFPVLVSYRLARAKANKKVEALEGDVDSPAKLKAGLGQSALYILPDGPAQVLWQ